MRPLRIAYLKNFSGRYPNLFTATSGFVQSDVVFFVLLSDLRDLPCSQERLSCLPEKVTKYSYIKERKAAAKDREDDQSSNEQTCEEDEWR